MRPRRAEPATAHRAQAPPPMRISSPPDAPSGIVDGVGPDGGPSGGMVHATASIPAPDTRPGRRRDRPGPVLRHADGPTPATPGPGRTGPRGGHAVPGDGL